MDECECCGKEVAENERHVWYDEYTNTWEASCPYCGYWFGHT